VLLGLCAWRSGSSPCGRPRRRWPATRGRPSDLLLHLHLLHLHLLLLHLHVWLLLHLALPLHLHLLLLHLLLLLKLLLPLHLLLLHHRLPLVVLLHHITTTRRVPRRAVRIALFCHCKSIEKIHVARRAPHGCTLTLLLMAGLRFRPWAIVGEDAARNG